MPSGRTHDRITLWSLPFVTGIAFEQTQSGKLTLLVSGAFLFSGLMFGPDLDLYSIQYKRWGWLRWIWIPYQKLLRHRSLLSHGLIIGTTLRLLYLAIWLGILGILAFSITTLVGSVGWNWHLLIQSAQRLALYRSEWLALFVGLELGAMSHAISDWGSSTYKRSKKQGWSVWLPHGKIKKRKQHLGLIALTELRVVKSSDRHSLTVVSNMSNLQSSQRSNEGASTLQSSTATLAALQELIDVVAKLRSPDGGCPWDLAQTPQTLTPYVIEEAYEVVDAIASGETSAIAEELGDLLLQVVLQAQIAAEEKTFSLKEVAQGITQKLIRRHPHVFGDVQVQNIDDVRQNWEQIKAAEKGDTAPQLSRKLSRIARTLPPLLGSMKISHQAAAAGLEWENIDGVWAKFHEELAEFQQAIAQETPAQQQAELGDLLFVLINLARWYNLDPSAALQGTNHRFIQRLEKIEAVAKRPLSDYTLEELEVLWQQAKAEIALREKGKN